jgi:hypothetical protein
MKFDSFLHPPEPRYNGYVGSSDPSEHRSS